MLRKRILTALKEFLDTLNQINEVNIAYFFSVKEGLIAKEIQVYLYSNIQEIIHSKIELISNKRRAIAALHQRMKNMNNAGNQIIRNCKYLRIKILLSDVFLRIYHPVSFI